MCSPVLYGMLKCLEALFFPALFSPFPCPFAWYPFWCHSDRSCLLTITLQAEQTSKHTHGRADPCKTEQHPDANHEEHFLDHVTRDPYRALYQLGRGFQKISFPDRPTWVTSSTRWVMGCHIQTAAFSHAVRINCWTGVASLSLGNQYSVVATYLWRKKLCHWALLCFRHIFNIPISYLFRKLIQFLILEMSGVLSIPLAEEHSLVATRWTMSPLAYWDNAGHRAPHHSLPELTSELITKTK